MDELKSRDELLLEVKSLRGQLKNNNGNGNTSSQTPPEDGLTASIFRSLVENMLDATLIVDWDGKILLANRAALKLVELDDNREKQSFNIFDFIVPEYHEAVKHHLQLVREGKDGFLAEYKIRTRHNQEKWVEGLGARFNLFGRIVDYVTLRDITRRKNSERVFRESEERYRTLFDHAIDAIFLMKEEIIVDCNSKAEILFGLKKDELLGHSPALFSPELQPDGESSPNKASLKIKKALNGEAQVFEWLHQKKNGAVFYTEVNLNRIDIRGSMHLLAFIRDITDRKIAEISLRESEERYRQLIRQSPLGIFLADVRGNLKVVNSSLLKMLNSPSEEALKNINLFTSKAVRTAGLNDMVTRCIDAGVSVNGEFPFHSRWGERIFCRIYLDPVRDASQTITGVQGIVEDISEHKAAEAALKESEKRYRHLIEHSSDAIYLLYERKFEVINEKFKQIFEVTLEDVNLPGFDFSQLVAAKSKPFIEERFQRVRKGETLPPSYEFTAVSKSGKEIEVEASVSYIHYKNGIATQGIIRDITERKRLERQLYQAQKMEAIGRLAGGIAHDFNNLLTVIQGYSELLLSGIDENDKSYKSILQIDKATKRAESLTQQLLAFSRKQIMKPKVLDFNELITESEKMLKRLIGEDIELVKILDPELGNIQADPGQMEQVFMNLAVNARDAMPEGGKITIETRNILLDDDYCTLHPEVKPGNYVRFSITDTGMGMDKHVQSQIFEPFFTTKGKGKGTGLGLSTLYGIIKQSNGYIYVYSEPGEGTTFKIYLPMVTGKVESRRREQLSEENLSGTETILVAEDEEEVRQLVRKTLQEKGYTVIAAPHGEEAVQLFNSYNGKIDLILTDVVMPKMSGRELANRIRSAHPDMNILFMSGYTDNAIVNHGILDKETNFIQKPFTPKSLLNKIRTVLENPVSRTAD